MAPAAVVMGGRRLGMTIALPKFCALHKYIQLNQLLQSDTRLLANPVNNYNVNKDCQLS